MRSEEEIRQAYEAIAYFGFGSKYPPNVKPNEKAVIVARTLKWVLEGCNKKDSDSEQEQECERLKKKLKPKLKNAHCAYFDGQTGWCKAKEFIRCNPIGCKLYTIDELSTIVDLQQQLDQLGQTLTEIKEIAEGRSNYPCSKCIKTEILQKISEVTK